MKPEREVGASGPITIDRTSPVPLYFQLAQHFESAGVVCGQGRLPTQQVEGGALLGSRFGEG